jgi:Ca2+-binding RTX toxin-like protein
MLAAQVENLTFNGAGDFVGNGNGLANSVTGGVGDDVLSGGDGNATLINGGFESRLTGWTVTGMPLSTHTSARRLSEGKAYLPLGGWSNKAGATASQTFATEAGRTYTLAFDARTEGVVGREQLRVEIVSGTTTLATRTISPTAAHGTYELSFTATGQKTTLRFVHAASASGDIDIDAVRFIGANDTLDGGRGTDTLIGGLGNDTYIVDRADDVVTEAAGEGIDTVRTNIAFYTLGANVENLAFIGVGNFTGSGNALANSMTGGAGDDVLFSGDSSTVVINGGFENGVTGWSIAGMRAATHNSVARLSEGKAYLPLGGWTGGAGATASQAFTTEAGKTYTLGLNARTSGAPGREQLRVDVLSDNTLLATRTISPAAFHATYDITFTATGDSTTLQFVHAASAGGDVDIDAVRFLSANDTLDGAAGNDLLDGGGGDDSLVGGTGDDTLEGGMGNDRLVAGGGSDLLRGGTGSDLYVIGSGQTVVDNTGGDGSSLDEIVLTGASSASSVWLSRSLNDLVLAIGSDGTVVRNWYTQSADERVDAFSIADGQKLRAAKVDDLVTAMAQFSTSSGVPVGQRPTLPLSTSLQLAISSAWTA